MLGGEVGDGGAGELMVVEAIVVGGRVAAGPLVASVSEAPRGTGVDDAILMGGGGETAVAEMGRREEGGESRVLAWRRVFMGEEEANMWRAGLSGARSR